MWITRVATPDRGKSSKKSGQASDRYCIYALVTVCCNYTGTADARWKHASPLELLEDEGISLAPDDYDERLAIFVMNFLLGDDGE